MPTRPEKPGRIRTPRANGSSRPPGVTEQLLPSPPALPPGRPADENTLYTADLPEGVSALRQSANMAVSGTVGNAKTIGLFSKPTLGVLDLTASMRALEAQIAAVNSGDLRAAEGMLAAQAVSLNAIFGEMARRASLNIGEHMDATERYMRLALKAQGQCRSTLESLAAIKNPPIVFARQANFAHGPQQVNNGVDGSLSPRTGRGENPLILQDELLEARDGGRLVGGGTEGVREGLPVDAGRKP